MKIFLFIFMCTIFSLESVAESDDVYLDLGDSHSRELKMEINDAVQAEESQAKAVEQKETATKQAISTKKRQLASFKQGFKTSKKKCVMYKKPDSSSSQLLNIRNGKRLWLEGYNEHWLKAFSRKGEGFLPTDCF